MICLLPLVTARDDRPIGTEIVASPQSVGSLAGEGPSKGPMDRSHVLGTTMQRDTR